MIRPEHRRCPGFNEQTFLFRNNGGFYSNFNVTARYNKHILRAVLSNALALLISKNLWLAYNFFKVRDTEPPNTKKDYELRYVDSICFESVVEYRKVPNFDEDTFVTMNEFNNKIGNNNAPLWQICVFETDEAQYLCAYFCHSLADGGTGLQFHKDLAKELALCENAETDVDVLFKYHSELPRLKPPVETLTDLYYPSTIKKILFWVEAKFPSIILGIKKLISLYGGTTPTPVFKSVAVEKDLRTKFKVVNFLPLQVKRITEYCRSNGFTLTPFFNILGLNSIEKTIYPHFPQPNGSISYSSLNFIAIEGRRYYLRLSAPFTYGTLVCGAPTVYHPMDLKSDEDLVENIKEFHAIIQRELETKRSFKLVWLNLIIDFPRLLWNKIGKFERYTTMISNLGKVVDDPRLQWKIVDAWFGLNTSTNYHFILNMVSTETGGLNLVIPYLPLYSELELQVDGKRIPAMDQFVLLLQETITRLIE